MAEYMIGDRVRRNAVENNAEYSAGMLGTVVPPTKGQPNEVSVVWDKYPHEHVNYAPHDAHKLELHSPAPTPPPAIVQRAIAHETQAQAQCRQVGLSDIQSQLSAYNAEMANSRQQYMQQQDWRVSTRPPTDQRIPALEEDCRKLRSELGDLRGERDTLRNRCHELETALQFAERELARMQKAGRK